MDTQETQKTTLPGTQRATLSGTPREKTLGNPKMSITTMSSTPIYTKFSSSSIDCSYYLSSSSTSVTPERSTHKTTFVPVIREFNKADKYVFKEIINFPKADKETKLTVIKPPSMP